MNRVVAFVGLSALILAPVVANAHNAGHLFLPDGSCVELGSFKEAPLVGPDNEQLDLIPTTRQDEYGVSFVGVAGDNLIFPGPCPAPPPTATTAPAEK